MNVAWNPGFLGLFAACLSSGSVIVMELTETEIKTLASLPADHKASASEKLFFSILYSTDLQLFLVFKIVI